MARDGAWASAVEGDAAYRARASLARSASVDEAVAAIAPGAVGARDILGATRQLHAAVGGAGWALQPLLDDRDVTDVLVNGTKGVWVDRGGGLSEVPEARGAFATDDDVRGLAVRLAAACGQRLDDSCPIVDGTFGSGLRLHAVLPPLSAEGPLISLRAHRAVSYSLDDLGRLGTFDPAVRGILDAMVRRRANVVVSGATGSGKTTLLAALLGEVAPGERILVIEESAELRPVHPHVVHLQVRRANVQGRGEVTMSELVRAAMRMRPDRIVLGECRSAEVREVLAALNTGHEGGWATIHANSAFDVPARFVALGALAGMGEDAVAAQAASALDAVLHIERQGTRRVLSQIAVLERAAGRLEARLALDCRRATGAGRPEKGPGWARLAERLGLGEDARCSGGRAAGERRRAGGAGGAGAGGAGGLGGSVGIDGQSRIGGRDIEVADAGVDGRAACTGAPGLRADGGDWSAGADDIEMKTDVGGRAGARARGARVDVGGRAGGVVDRAAGLASGDVSGRASGDVSGHVLVPVSGGATGSARGLAAGPASGRHSGPATAGVSGAAPVRIPGEAGLVPAWAEVGS